MKNKLFYLTVKVQTTQKNLLLNTLSKAKIVVFNLKIESNYITFSLKIKDSVKTFAILKNMCYNYYVCDKRTPKSLFLTLLKRLAFISSFIMSLALVYFGSQMVVGVKVYADDVAIKEQILAIDEISNFSPCFASKVDLVKIRKNVRDISSVAECSLKIKGNYISLSVTLAPKQEDRNPIYSSYTAKYDATITEIIAHKGTPLVKVGQRVFAGTPLISPSAFNESGEEIINTGIEGKVFGEVVFSKTFTIDCQRVEKVKSGRKQTFTSLALNKVVAPSPYKLYESRINTGVFDIFLPVYYTKTTYEEIIERVVEVDIEKYCQNALYELAIEKGVVGETQTYSYEEINGKYKISLYLKTITEVGVGE